MDNTQVCGPVDRNSAALPREGAPAFLGAARQAAPC